MSAAPSPHPAVHTPLRPSRTHCKLSPKLQTASLKRRGQLCCALGGPVSAVPVGVRSPHSSGSLKGIGLALGTSSEWPL